MITAHLWSNCIMSAVSWNISLNILSLIATKLLSHFLPFIRHHRKPFTTYWFENNSWVPCFSFLCSEETSIQKYKMFLFLVCRLFDPDCKNKDTTQRSDTLVWQTALERYFNKRDFLDFTVGVPPIFWGQPQLP